MVEMLRRNARIGLRMRLRVSMGQIGSVGHIAGVTMIDVVQEMCLGWDMSFRA